MSEPRRVWTCDICGRSDVWTDGWEWYGTFVAGLGEEPPDAVVCSPECKKEHAAASFIRLFPEE